MAKNDTAATETDQQKRNRIRNAVERQVIENHKDEFQQMLETEYDKAGLKYNRRLTAQERAEREEAERKAKAKAKLDALLAANPDLIDVLREQEAQQPGEAEAQQWPDDEPVEAPAEQV